MVMVMIMIGAAGGLYRSLLVGMPVPLPAMIMRVNVRVDCSLFFPLGPGLGEDLERRGEEQASHDTGNGQIRPGGGGAPDTERCNHDDDIADGIVA